MCFFFFFFFNDTATTEIYTLSLHDALPISVKTFDELFAELSEKAATRPAGSGTVAALDAGVHAQGKKLLEEAGEVDRKSTRLNSSHANISYAVFCLKKKKHKSLPT